MLSILALAGLAGFFSSLGEINKNYVKGKNEIISLKKNLMHSESSGKMKDLKLSNYDFLQYKMNAFSTRFPVYSDILDSVYTASFKYDFKPELVLSIIQVESNFNPEAISYKGAYGLMQINLAVWERELDINREKIFDIDYNIDLGLQVLKRYYDETKGNLKRAIHLYNNGYKYNNLAYVHKVDSTLMSFTPFRSEQRKVASPN